MQHVQVYNDVVYDLLDGLAAADKKAHPAAAGHRKECKQDRGNNLRHQLLQPQDGGGRRVLRIREDGRGRILIPGLSEVGWAVCL